MPRNHPRQLVQDAGRADGVHHDADRVVLHVSSQCSPRKMDRGAGDPANLGCSGSQNENGEQRVQIVAGVDLGGTAVNYTLVNGEEKFLIEGLCEHPALSKQGPDVCLQQIEDGLADRRRQGGRCCSPTSWPSVSTRPVRPAAPAC